MRLVLSILCVATALLLASGCGGPQETKQAACQSVACAPCFPGGVSVFVRDLATGGSIDGVTIEGFVCSLQPPTDTWCHAPFRAGTDAYDVTISAPAHAPSVLHVVENETPLPASGCCGACPAVSSFMVTLAPT